MALVFYENSCSLQRTGPHHSIVLVEGMLEHPDKRQDVSTELNIALKADCC